MCSNKIWRQGIVKYESVVDAFGVAAKASPAENSSIRYLVR
jgi:hypothetical protein